MATTNTSTSAKRINFKVWATVISAAVFTIALVVFLLVSETAKEFYTTMILGIAGALLGWLIAFITAPYDDTDKGKLTSFSKLTGSFITGYVLSKSDKTLQKILDPEKLADSIDGIRLVVFACFFILAFIVVYVFRVYVKAN